MSLENTNTVNREFVNRVVDDVVKVIDSFGLRVTRAIYSNIVQSDEFSNYMATYTEVAIFKHVRDIVCLFDKNVTSESCKSFDQLYDVMDKNKLYITQAINTMYDRYINGYYDNYIIDLATHLAESFEHTRTKILPIANNLSREFANIYCENMGLKAKCSVIEIALPAYCVDLYNELSDEKGNDILSSIPSLDTLISKVKWDTVIDLSLNEIVSISTLTRSDLIAVAEQMLDKSGVCRIFDENEIMTYGHLMDSFYEFISNGTQYSFDSLIEYSILFNGIRDNSSMYETNQNIRDCVDGIISYINVEIIGSTKQYLEDIKNNRLILNVEDTRFSDKDNVAKITVNKSVLVNMLDDLPTAFIDEYYISVAYLNVTKSLSHALQAVDIVSTVNKYGELARKMFDLPANKTKELILEGYLHAVNNLFESLNTNQMYRDVSTSVNSIIFGGVDICDHELMAASIVEAIIADANDLVGSVKKIKSLNDLGYDINSAVIYGYVENVIDNILNAVTVYKPKIPKSGVIV